MDYNAPIELNRSSNNDLGPEIWHKFRLEMPVAQQLAYFDHAAVAPLSRPAQVAISGYAQQASELGDTVWPDWDRRMTHIRQTATQLIGCQEEEMALVANTTAGISIVAEGFPWKSGDNVVTLANEFPSNLYPWMNLKSRGVETRQVPCRGSWQADDLLGACDSQTRMIAVSWVSYSNGFRADLDELVHRAHANDILVMVDAIQGMGVFPLDVTATPIDFLAADGHKWMLGPEGAGLLYIAGRNLDRLRCQGVGWNSVSHRFDFSRIDLDLRDEAARFEGGSQNIVGFFGLGASLDLLVSTGIAQIAERILDVRQECIDALESQGAEVFGRWPRENASGIVAFTVPQQDPVAVRRRCLQAGVVLSCRDGRLRIAPHAYNNQDDIERLIKALPNNG